MKIRPGNSYPLGATWDGVGFNFAIFSEHATRVELCLFDSAESTTETQRVASPEKTNQVWHGYLTDPRPGQSYGYRVHGPSEPAIGQRFNPSKIVLDPYAKAISRTLRWGPGMFGDKIGDPSEDMSVDNRNNAVVAPLAAVVDPAFTWGDEIGRSQRGNNHADCQDNDISWFQWELSPDQKELLAFAQRVVRIRRQQPVLQRRHFFNGRKIRGSDVKDISFFEPSGSEMTDHAWNADFVRCLGIRLAGDLLQEMNEHGDPVVGDTLFLMLNAHHDRIPFKLPAVRPDQRWQCLMDTADPECESRVLRMGVRFELKARSLVLLRVVKENREAKDS